jgi:hypothetical protein
MIHDKNIHDSPLSPGHDSNFGHTSARRGRTVDAETDRDPLPALKWVQKEPTSPKMPHRVCRSNEDRLRIESLAFSPALLGSGKRMDDFIRRVSALTVLELEKDIATYESHCLMYLEAYKTCRSDECRMSVRSYIAFYEERIQVLKEFLEFKLLNTQ